MKSIKHLRVQLQSGMPLQWGAPEKNALPRGRFLPIDRPSLIGVGPMSDLDRTPGAAAGV